MATPTEPYIKLPCGGGLVCLMVLVRLVLMVLVALLLELMLAADVVGLVAVVVVLDTHLVRQLLELQSLDKDSMVVLILVEVMLHT